MILPEKSSGISLSCQTLRRSPSCPLFRRSSTCSLCHFHIPTLSDHSSSIPASEKSASHGKLHGDTLSNHNPSVGITQIRCGRSSQLPLSLSISSPVYGNQYKIWKGICQQEICGLPVRRICLSVTCPRFTVGRYLLRTLAPLVAITSLYQSKDFFLFLLNVPLP